MNVLGVDAGKHLGYAFLHRIGGSWLHCGSGVASGPEALRLLIQRMDLVVIEEPRQILPSERLSRAGHRVAIGMANQLLATKDIGRDVERIALREGVPVVTITSSEARRRIGVRIGGRGATKGDVDRQVGVAVPRLVSEWPTRSNNHERDAAVAAIAGHARWQAEQARHGARRAVK